RGFLAAAHSGQLSINRSRGGAGVLRSEDAPGFRAADIARSGYDGWMQPGAHALQFSFADHTLDPARRELRRGEESIAVEPQVFDLLAYLVRSRDRGVRKDDLIATVWGGRIVSDATLSSRIYAARKA